jgi:hypothetical protein
VPAEHHDDPARAASGVGYRAHHGAEVARHEDIGERTKERAERAVVAGWLREVAGVDLVRAYGDRNRAYRRKIRLGRSGRRV